MPRSSDRAYVVWSFVLPTPLARAVNLKRRRTGMGRRQLIRKDPTTGANVRHPQDEFDQWLEARLREWLAEP